MFSHKHYVPVLKCKGGDLWSLANIKVESKPHITPVIEMVPPSEKATEVEQLRKSVASVQNRWGSRPFFADLLWRKDIPVTPTGHIVDVFHDFARARGLAAIPVTSPDRSPSYQSAVRRAVASDGRGIAIRLTPRHLGNSQKSAQVLAAMTTLFGVEPSKMDLLLDFGHIAAVPADLVPTLMTSAVASIPTLPSWRTLTVISGSFPASVSSLNQGIWNILPRVEWIGWREAFIDSHLSSRLPSYGDYTVGDPGLPFSGFAQYSVNFRYSHADTFFVWRGHTAATHPRGNSQIFDICADLVARPEYAGPQFSEGDRQVDMKATTVGSTGNAQSWRMWATNHYLELVVSQIANLPEP